MNPETAFRELLSSNNPSRFGAMRALLRQFPHTGKVVRYNNGTNLRKWIENEAKLELWSKPIELLQAIRNHQKICLVGCHRVSKSTTLGAIAAGWIDTHHAGQGMVLATAHRVSQVRMGVWRQLQRTHETARLRGEILATEWKMTVGKSEREEVIAMARKPSDTDPGGFPGIYNKYVLAIGDEACFIPKILISSLETLASNDTSKIILSGNPDDETSYFRKLCMPGSGWKVIEISAFNSPNFTDEVVSPKLGSLLISPKWAEDKAREYGKESAWYGSKVLGVWPEMSEDSLYRLSWVLESEARFEEMSRRLPVTLGVDVGRGGDITTICRNSGGKCEILFSKKTPNTMKIVEEVMRVLVAEPVISNAYIDVIGVGAGVVDRLEEISLDENVTEVERTAAGKVEGIAVSSSATNSEKFVNLRAEIHWHARHRLEVGTISHDNEAVTKQMLQAKYKNRGGRIAVVDKKDYATSPDEFEAVLLSCMKDLLNKAAKDKKDKEGGYITAE
jgi:hypothetical protein